MIEKQGALMDVIYKTEKDIDKNQLIELYRENGWEAYLTDTEKLHRAVKNSATVITAWFEEELVGLIRTISDGETITYIQDILLLNKFKRHGIGSKLINMIMENNKDIRQCVLLTDNEKRTVSFYESLGFKQSDKYNCISFMKPS